MADDQNRFSTARTPRWVKVQATFVLLLILVVAAMSTGFLGGHGHDYGALPDNEQHVGGH